MKKTFVWLVLVVAVLFAGAYAWRWYLIKEMRKPVLAELRDPDSAKFRDERFVGPWMVTDDAILCGELNAKNGMGGYIGYGKFEVYDRWKTALNPSVGMTLCEAMEEKKPWWWLRW
ncbi:hypothetical protein NUK34_08220 [Kerstersia gyiorum]|uniref:hypothetical protein n=1 Tax=Kerstersia gyiorum TaxID=206506 RepID=UPI00215064B2|nr:hypothetical protein [Kerstersia gyiorum]MCR4158836.1 hypothetical protein [Kerstersia gyiorum]